MGLPVHGSITEEISMAEGADDVGDDFEIGNVNHCTEMTQLILDGDDSQPFDPTLIELSVLQVFPMFRKAPVHGIVGSGINGGSGIVGSLVDVGGGPAILGQGLSSTSPGVLGTNDLGPGVSGISNAQGGLAAVNGRPVAVGVFGKADDGFGVFGESSQGTGVFGQSKSATGVIGESSGGPGVVGKSSGSHAGVVGQSPSGNGVVGESFSGGIGVLGYGSIGVSGKAAGGGIGVSGEGASGPGVRAISKDGVAAFATSDSERAGVFLSGSHPPGTGPLVRTSQGGIAQMRLVPSSDPKLPAKGSIGDLFVHQVVSPTAGAINLYLCVSDQPVAWQQVQLAATIYPGGSPAP
jgi:hypothetical protein